MVDLLGGLDPFPLGGMNGINCAGCWKVNWLMEPVTGPRTEREALREKTVEVPCGNLATVVEAPTVPVLLLLPLKTPLPLLSALFGDAIRFSGKFIFMPTTDPLTRRF